MEPVRGARDASFRDSGRPAAATVDRRAGLGDAARKVGDRGVPSGSGGAELTQPAGDPVRSREAAPRPDSVPADRQGEGSVSALTPRALVIGIVCVAITCCVVCYAELVVGKIQIGFLQLPPVVVGMLVLLLGAQAL